MTIIVGTVVGLTFLFGFGNVLTLALRLGVPVWVAPLAVPAVDLSIVGVQLAAGTLPCTARRRSNFGQRDDCCCSRASLRLH